MAHTDAYYQRYQTLFEAAEAFGDVQEAGRARRRMESFDQPFTLLVAGHPGAGKSTVIDQIAGKAVAAAGSDSPWVNLYRCFRGAHPYAVVHFRGNPERGQILPVERARLAAEEAGSLPANDPAGIVRIAWYVDAPELPEHVTLMEASCSTSEELGGLVSQADAVLLVLRADKLSTKWVRAFAGHLEGTQAMAVLTHMDRVANERTPEVVRQVRVYGRPHLDRVITLAAHPALGPTGLQQASGPLRREVQKRFFASAQEIRERSHARIMERAQASLTRRFETRVDRVAADRWRYLEFERSTEEALQLRAAEAWRIGEAYLDELQAWAYRRGEALERGSAAPAELAPRPLPTFFQTLEAGFTSEIRRIVSELRYSDGEEAAAKNRMAASLERAAALRLPAAPAFPFAVLRGDVVLSGQDPGAALREFQPEGGLEAGAAQQAALWQPVQDWVGGVAAQAARALKAWITSVCETACGWLRARAADLFRAAHGFAPSEAAASVLRMEGHYMRLIGKTTLVRTPHLKQGWISPALLLLRLQEEGFIRHWNETLARYTAPAVMAQAYSRLRAQIGRLRGAALDEWEGSLPEVQRDAAPLLKRLTRREILSDRLIWPQSWVPAPPRLRSAALPQIRLLKRSGSDPALEGCAGLFLRNSNEAFMAPAEKAASSPEALALAVLQEEMEPEMAGLWPVHGPLEVPLGVRSKAIRYTAALAAVLVCLAGLGVVLFGMGAQVLLLLAAGLLVLGFGAARGIERVLRKQIAQAQGGYAAAVHSAVREKLSAQFDRLQARLDELAVSDDLGEILELAMLNRQAHPTAVYMPYGELVRRLAKGGVGV